MNKRQANFDLLRLVLSFMVVVLHICGSIWNIVEVDSLDFKTISFYNNLVRSSVPLFFMLSGYFAISREFNFEKIIKKAFKIFTIFIVWSIIYGLLTLIDKDNLNFRIVIEAIIEGKYHLWFLSALAWSYLFFPALYSLREFQDGKYVKYIVLMFFLMGILKRSLVSYLKFTEHYLVTSFIDKFGLYYIVGLIYFCLLGYYLSTINLKIKKSYLLFIFIACVIVNTLLTNYYSFVSSEPVGIFMENFNILVFFEGVSLFLLFKNLDTSVLSLNIEKFITSNSKTMLGIYLIHPFIMDIFSHFGFNILGYNLSYGIFLYSLLVFIVSFVFVKISLKIPLIKFLYKF